MTDAQLTPARATTPWWAPQMRDVLATSSTLLIGAAFLIPAAVPHAVVDQDLKGAIILQWGLVMGFYFGTSKGSAAKDDTISTMAATASTTPQAKP
jgi:hypothetical protein